jgi:hypothetical protein
MKFLSYKCIFSVTVIVNNYVYSTWILLAGNCRELSLDNFSDGVMKTAVRLSYASAESDKGFIWMYSFWRKDARITSSEQNGWECESWSRCFVHRHPFQSTVSKLCKLFSDITGMGDLIHTRQVRVSFWGSQSVVSRKLLVLSIFGFCYHAVCWTPGFFFKPVWPIFWNRMWKRRKLFAACCNGLWEPECGTCHILHLRSSVSMRMTKAADWPS